MTYQWYDVEVISFAGMHKKQLRSFLAMAQDMET